MARARPRRSRPKGRQSYRVGAEREVTAADIHIGLRMRKARALSGLTWKEITAALGMSYQGIGRYERGQVRVSAYTLSRLAGLYKVPIRFFFEGLDIPQVPTMRRESVRRIELQLVRAFRRLRDKRVQWEIVRSLRVIEHSYTGRMARSALHPAPKLTLSHSRASRRFCRLERE